MLLRHPDIPSRELSRNMLRDMPGWFATIKIDGWRCMAYAKDGVASFWSKKLLPLEVCEEVRTPFLKDCFETLGGNWLLDCELTGNRRAGDASAIYIISVLDPVVDVPEIGQAYCRWRVAHELLPQYAVPGTESDFAKFYDSYQDDPLAEGIVLMKNDARYIGSTIGPAKNPGTIKVKWRAGMSGTTWKE